MNGKVRAPVAVIGIGTEMRGDDGLGPAAAALLHEQLRTGDNPDIDVVILDGEPTRLIEEWRDREMVVVIDAVKNGGDGGEIHRVEIGDIAGIDRAPAASSHHGGLADAVALGKVLDRLPRRLVVYGVEPVEMATGSGLSPEVRRALPRVVDEVLAEVHRDAPATPASPTIRRRIDVIGVVQGVGFRPFVNRLATDLGLNGYVRNETGSVQVEVEGRPDVIDQFQQRLRVEGPPMARVDELQIGSALPRSESGFVIAPSRVAIASAPSIIPADQATCEDCLRELLDPMDRRYRHPFITCTNCGPRFTITRNVPYDRANTTMAEFAMCPDCRGEYDDPTDRRHHAQPLACPECGPRLRFTRPGLEPEWGDSAIAVTQTSLADGAVIGVKGIGGFHLAADATNEAAVDRLRARKHRPDKPFAVMVADLATARRLATVSDAEATALESPERPIVLLDALPDSPLAEAVAPGSPLVGVMLPCAPLQHLLFMAVPDATAQQGLAVPEILVMTSGNLAGEPICHTDADAESRLGPLVDAFLTHDRAIHRPCDDSIVRLVDHTVMLVRRSRGYVPLPLRLPFAVAPTLAAGGDIKNTCCVASGRAAWLSQHLGDMANLESLDALSASADVLAELSSTRPDTIAVDLHPGYRTRSWAEARQLVGEGTPHRLDVAHHHAHAVALMAEHRLAETVSLLTFVFDGTGFGPDHQLWGGEVLLARYDSFDRLAHLTEVPLPGGDAAVINPCRFALAHLRAAGIDWEPDIGAVGACSSDERRAVAALISKPTVRTTSMGRLFDAVASILGIRHRISYEAQAAIELEAWAARSAGTDITLRFAAADHGTIDAAPVVRGLVDGLRSGVEVADLALAFHEAVVAVVVDIAVKARTDHDCEVVGLSGGVFQNVVLVRATRHALIGAGFEVLVHERIPPNDGGLALGQAVIAGRHGHHPREPHRQEEEPDRRCV